MRYAVVGTGSRAGMYIGALTGDHAAAGELVAWCEPNPTRADWHGKRIGAELPRYEPAELERMIIEERVDRVVVTTPDHAHAQMVSRAMRAGADVVVEKPLTISDAGCREIVEAMRETGRDLVMTFNYRYSPRNSELRRIIAEGEIGTVLSVHFEWVLDTAHGADYFRRWHRLKDSSGGLLIHKSSHHFDLVNWWLQDVPARVYATGGLKFYGPDAAGAPDAGDRPARGSEGRADDPWSLDISADPKLKELYFDAEHHDGYIRDQDVFAPGITIEDDLGVVVDYAGGPFMTYNLTAHAPWEGYRVIVNGSQGRAELDVVERSWVDSDAVVDPSANPVEQAERTRPVGERLLVQRHWEPAREVEIPQGIGGHGGGDAFLLQDIFAPGTREDPLAQAAGVLDGVRAVCVGIAGNASLVSGGPVLISDLDLGVDPAASELAVG